MKSNFTLFFVPEGCRKLRQCASVSGYEYVFPIIFQNLGNSGKKRAPIKTGLSSNRHTIGIDIRQLLYLTRKHDF